MSGRGVLWVLALLLAPAWAHAGAQASLDRSRVQLGETVTLNLRVQGGGTGTPDLTPLAQDFTILGMSSNSSISIVNGRRHDELTYGVALQPKRIGQLTIPPLSVAGSRTTPLLLEVVAPEQQAATGGGKDVFIETQAEPDTVYVGQQLVFTVRLYYAAALSSGALADPRLAGVDMRRLGDDINYDAERGGRSYHVIERRYAMIPQHAGRIEIPPLDFQGEMVDPSDPDSFFGMGTPVAAVSPAVRVQVQPTPRDWGDSTWLPARQLQLTLTGLPPDGKLRVGQPLDLTMTLQATGLPYEALPALSLPALDGATVYPDKPVTGTRADGQWIVGRRQQDFAVVPSRSGTLVLPATTLKWWNVQSGQAESARIPARTLTVLPAAGAAAPAAAASTPASQARPASDTAGRSPRVAERLRRWGVPGAIGLALLVAGGLGWRRRVRRRAQATRLTSAAAPSSGPSFPPAAASLPDASSSRARRAAFMAVARDGTPASQAHSLLAWARAERPGLPHLGALAAALAAEPQRAAIAELQRRHYAGAPADTPLALDRVFADGFVWRTTPADGDDGELPPLYPFKLH